jgi:hypothetical protein
VGENGVRVTVPPLTVRLHGYLTISDLRERRNTRDADEASPKAQASNCIGALWQFA